MKLYDYQADAVMKLKNGNILCGQVGSGKSIVALVYYIFKVCRGEFPLDYQISYQPMRTPRDLYIITTAKKRDDLEWEKECANFGLSKEDVGWGVTVTIDSWNNIKKYSKVYGAFFIFDEQRLVGNGAWVKAFYKIANRNEWILLSATPGDSWSDYISVFVANKFYKNKTDFERQHCIYSGFTNYPKIDKYVGIRKLEKLRNSILVDMKDLRKTIRHNKYIKCYYDSDLYRLVMRDRWNPFDEEPIKESSKLLYLLREVVNSDESRIDEVRKIINQEDKVIIFYNFDYELLMLRTLMLEECKIYGEWNGHNHEMIPRADKWVYLVQYAAGCEGWNCIETNQMIFFSQTYSYKTLEQAMGRIDRINTEFGDLYYYHLYSNSKIDLAIKRCIDAKKNFNEKRFLNNKYTKN